MEWLIRTHFRLLGTGIENPAFGLYEHIAAVVWVLLSVMVWSAFLYLVISVIRFHYHAYIQTGKMPGLFDLSGDFDGAYNIPGFNVGVVFGFGGACIFLVCFLMIAIFLGYAWPFAILLFSTISTPYIIKYVARKRRFVHCLKHEGTK